MLHIESQIGLSLGLGGNVGHRHIAGEAMASQNLGYAQTGLLGEVEAVAENACHFLRGMEAGTMGSYGKVPTPLALAKQCQNGLHLALGSTLVPCKLCLNMGCGKFFLHTVAYLVALALTLIHILLQSLGILTVACLACTVDMSQRTHDVVVGIFDATLCDIGHVAVGTRHAALIVDSHLRDLISRMLRLEDGRATEGMDIVVEAYLVVVFFYGLHGHAAVLREHEVVGALLEIVFRMALCADQRAHLLMGSLFHVHATTLPGLIECRARRTQVHGLRVVAVGASHRIHYLIAPIRPFGLIEGGRPHLGHQPWHIRSLTGPACAGLRLLAGCHARCASTENLTHVLKRMPVPTGRVVVPREGIPSPQHGHFRPLSQHVLSLTAVELTLESGV